MLFVNGLYTLECWLYNVHGGMRHCMSWLNVVESWDRGHLAHFSVFFNCESICCFMYVKVILSWALILLLSLNSLRILFLFLTFFCLNKVNRCRRGLINYFFIHLFQVKLLLFYIIHIFMFIIVGLILLKAKLKVQC